MAYKCISRVECECENGIKVVYDNEQRVQNIEIPANCKKIVCIKEGGDSDRYSMEILQKESADEPLSKDEKKQLGSLLEELDHRCTTDIPSMSYSDITESEMFEFPEISKNILVSPDNGLWAYHGLRKLRFQFEDLQIEGEEWEISANLVFDHRDNDEMVAISSGKQDILQNTLYTTDTKKGYEFYVYVDTNKLGDKFDGEFASNQKILFSGHIEIKFQCTIKDEKMNDVTYLFPVELLVNNTNYDACKKLQKNTVSIDFGTSSSCVAVRGENGIELITLSALDDNMDVNIYENPTCVMIYRWKEIYEQWKLENKALPLILKGDLDEYKKDEKSVQFDFGYSVKDHLREVDDEQLNSIVTEIKMIPKYLDEGEQISIRPLVPQEKKVVHLVDSHQEQDDEHFDIIAFYGYILGKAINRVERNKIYTKFQVTYPVKFSEAVKEKVRASLEYGLQRSLPVPLRTAKNEKDKPVFQVKMVYPEPVAYIGSVCGKYLTYDIKNPQAQTFAVFDFGGGTLDYSFGVFAPDERDPNSSNIFVLGVDGDSDVGGELLIKKMSYWLYTSPENMSVFVKNRIPFEKPAGETLPDGCPEELFNSSADAKSNVRKINERFTRDIFQGAATSAGSSEKVVQDKRSVLMPKTTSSEAASEESEKDAGKKTKQVVKAGQSGKVTLVDIDGKEVDVQVTVDEKVLTEKLTEVLRRKVGDFKDVMNRTFEQHKDVLDTCHIKYAEKKVHIFEAGNSSRNTILQEEMKSAFQGMEHDIMLIDETSDAFMLNVSDGKGAKPKKNALTPKTAVAFGQVSLSDYYVNEDAIKRSTGDAPFNWYIGNISRGNNQFNMIIDKANADAEWHLYGKINNPEEMKIYYAETPVSDADDLKLRTADVDGLDEDDQQKYLYIKVAGSDSLQCCACGKEKPDGEAAGFTVELK